MYLAGATATAALLLLLVSSSAAAATTAAVVPFDIPNPKSQVAAAAAYSCSYTVTIKTSCASPRLTRDAISIAFGDADRNEVYAPRIDDPSSRAFERCSTDTFKLAGPCGYGVCYLYLYRQGWDGWVPEWVKVYDPRSGGRPITFYYGVAVPGGVWYGFNHCPRVAAAGAVGSVAGEASGGRDGDDVAVM